MDSQAHEAKDTIVSDDDDVQIVKKTPRCEVCQQVAAKYKCPRCAMRTCSLPCVKKHKADGACTGVRDKTGFVKVKDFTDTHLLNDYRFLEELARSSDTASREMSKNRYKYWPPAMKTLESKALRRGTKIWFLPRPFTKRANNTSRYMKSSDTILWHIDWVFPQADIKHTTRAKDENTLEESLQRMYDLEPIMKHCLRGYVSRGLDELKFIMKKDRTKANDPRYYTLDPRKSIREVLEGKEVIEYPTVLVVYSEKYSDYQLVDSVEDQTAVNNKNLEKLPAAAAN